MNLAYFKPSKTNIVLSLSFFGIFIGITIVALITELGIYGQLHDIEENLAADMIYLVAILASVYLQAVFANWYTDE